MASDEASGALVAMALPSLASTAGHMPSSADSQSGRARGVWAAVQGGGSAAFLTCSAFSCSEPKKAAHEGSTDPGSAAHLA